MTDIREMKQEAISVLRRRFSEQRAMLARIDKRLVEYVGGICAHSGVEKGDEGDEHNLYEVLGAIKFLRLTRTYPMNAKKLRAVIRLREGNWERKDRNEESRKRAIGTDEDRWGEETPSASWRHSGGGLRNPSTSGSQVYRWQPFQVYALACIFLFQADIDTELTEDDRMELLDTEHIDEQGRIIDQRRLCTDFTFYAPRKTDKTGLSAFVQVWFFFFEDNNSECYCCANSSDQAKLLYRRTRFMLQQLDSGNRIRQTETVCDWRAQYKTFRDSSIRPLSAGGKTKDGMYAQLCCIDEYGSAPYTNGKSDMKMLVDVIQSSMGPRREPLSVTTTTAGRIMQGPFIEKLDALHALLQKELAIERGEAEALLSDDRTLCLLLEPDVWERDDEEFMLTSKTVRRKVNPMLGKIVQHQFYEDEIAKARLQGDTGEVMSKLFNVYQTAQVKTWITPQQIRDLQRPLRIDELSGNDGWMCTCGFDFSMGDDIYAVSYLCFRKREEGWTEFFCDLDAWVAEEAMLKSPLRPVYERWAKDGWLHVVPGATFETTLFLERISEIVENVMPIMAFGFDPAKSRQPVNDLTAMVVDAGADPRQTIIPVSQGFMAFNPTVLELTDCVLRRPEVLHFSESPLWPWQFGNCQLLVDRVGNQRPVKSGQNNKVDNVQALCNAWHVFDVLDGRVMQTAGE